jgi:polyhydroxyalkanoate synthesis regulator phasin
MILESHGGQSIAAGALYLTTTGEPIMFEALDKLFLAGLGAVSMTKEKAEQIFDEYVKKGEAQRGNKNGFVKELLETAEKARADMEKLISEQVKKAIAANPIATKEDIKRIEQKLDKIRLAAKGK